jgi:ubiquinone/menaquinone biosynthesis C-methylase UbiE
MAQEIAHLIPRGSKILDVGCGNGFIAHHLSALTGTPVIGIDLSVRTRAAIDYRQYDGYRFPVPDNAFDAVLLCYVLHHAQLLDVILRELSRTLRLDGRAIVYEDMPLTAVDRAVCWFHNQQWRRRTGPCTFRNAVEWRNQFLEAGFSIIGDRALSRWRNLAHPVSRRMFVLRLDRKERATDKHGLERI